MRRPSQRLINAIINGGVGLLVLVASWGAAIVWWVVGWDSLLTSGPPGPFAPLIVAGIGTLVAFAVWAGEGD